MDFAAFLNGIEHKPRLAAVRLLVDGIITQIERGAVSPEEAFHLYFHVDNIIYVQKSLRSRAGRELIERGSQLQDIISVLPQSIAKKALKDELETMR